MSLRPFLDSARMAPQGQVHYSATVTWPDYNERTLFIAGLFAGAEVLAEASPNGEVWLPYPLTEDGLAVVEPLMKDDLCFQPGVLFRLKVVGGTSDTSLSAWI